MSIILITGGNKGLGYESARQLIEMGHTVYIGSRNKERGMIAAKTLNAKMVVLDVTDDASVANAVQVIKSQEGCLDVLINNAGISGVYKKAEDITAGDMNKVFDTNVFGIVRVTNSFIPLLRKSSNPVIVNVSSGLGSFALANDKTTAESQVNSLTYCSAKAAVSMLTVQYAKALFDIKVNCVDPGSSATDLNGGKGLQSVYQGSEIIVKMATIGKDGPTGTFQSRHGIVAW